MHQFYRIILWDHQEEMHCLVVLCLLSAAVALPTPEQLRTNLPELPTPPELKSEENEQVSADAIPPVLDAPESEEAKNPSESAETPEVEKDGDKELNNKLADAINVIQKDSKESKDSTEPWEFKEFEERPKQEQPKEEKIEKNSKYEESKEGDEEEGPIIIQVLQKPSREGWMPTQNNYNFEPSKLFSYIYNLLFPNSGNSDQRDRPIIVREADFAFVDRN